MTEAVEIKVIFAQSQEDMPEDSLTIECEIPNNTWYFDICAFEWWSGFILAPRYCRFLYIFSLLVATIYYQISSKSTEKNNMLLIFKKAAELAKRQMKQKRDFCLI